VRKHCRTGECGAVPATAHRRNGRDPEDPDGVVGAVAHRRSDRLAVDPTEPEHHSWIFENRGWMECAGLDRRVFVVLEATDADGLELFDLLRGSDLHDLELGRRVLSGRL